MSEALIASLQKRLDEVTTESVGRKVKLRELTKAHADLVAQRDKLKTDHDALAVKAADLEKKLTAAPDQLGKKVAELEGQLRTRDHRDAFRTGLEGVKGKDKDGKEATYRLADKATVDSVWRELGYTAEGDAPDAAKVSEVLGKAVESHPFLFAPVEPAGSEHAPGGAQPGGNGSGLKAGPGANRNAQGTPPAGKPGDWIAKELAGYHRGADGRI